MKAPSRSTRTTARPCPFPRKITAAQLRVLELLHTHIPAGDPDGDAALRLSLERYGQLTPSCAAAASSSTDAAAWRPCRT